MNDHFLMQVFEGPGHRLGILELCHNPLATPKQFFWFVRMHLLLSVVLMVFV